MAQSKGQQRGILCLIGGGKPSYHSWSDLIYSTIIDLKSNSKIALVRYQEMDDWLINYFRWLGATDVRSFVIPNPQRADATELPALIREYEIIFLDGDEPGKFYDTWKNTLLEKVIRDAYQSGKIIAGHGAGAMIFSDVFFLTKNGDVQPKTLFRNPYLQSISLIDKFLNLLPEVMLDVHFTDHGNLLRMIPLLIRYAQTHHKTITGVGIDQHAALLISSELIGEVIGSETITILKPTPSSQVRFEFPKAPEYTHLELHRLVAGLRYDFNKQTVCDKQTEQPSEKFVTHPSISNELIFTSTRPAKHPLPDSNSGNTPLLQRFTKKSTHISIITSQQSYEIALDFQKVLKLTSNPEIAVIPITENKPESMIQAPLVKQSNGIIITGNNLKEMLTFLRSNLPVAKALRTRVKASVPLLLLNGAIELGGRWFLQSKKPGDANDINAYELIGGLNYLKNTIIISNLLKDESHFPLKIRTLFEALQNQQATLGILADQESTFTLTSDKTLRFSGNTPTIIIDFLSAQPHSTSSSETPLAWTGATLHCLHDDWEFDLREHGVRAIRG